MADSHNKTESIWNACCCALKTFILKRISDPSLAEDILQEVFLKIHSNIDTVKDEAKICSWVFQIARNTIIDHYRKHKPNLVDIDSIHYSDEEDEDNPVQNIHLDETVISFSFDEGESDISKEVAYGLKEVVESLPQKYAQALLLVEFDGISQIELAQRLGISVSGAKSRVQRGRQMLKDSLMRCCHYEFDKYGTILSRRPHECCCCN